MSDAQSLVCNVCKAILRSVKEAQDHAEATGHADFAESTEKPLRLVCTECGKACKSQTEWDLHEKRTGHATFEDKTGEQGPINTEVEMKEARQALKEDDADKPAESSEPAEMVPAESQINAELLEQMLQMGFAKNRAIRALHFSGNGGLDAAITWLSGHDEDADIDDELMIPKEKPKAKLTAEDLKELARKAKAKREAEEKELERIREQERIRAGRELAAAAKMEEDLRLKRMAEQRRLEKEEEERAREKIRRKLDEDRRERRRRLGLPEELTEEEKQAEAEKAAQKAAEEAKKKLPIKPVSAAEKMRELLVEMKKNHGSDDAALKTAWQTLFKFCGNVANNPKEEKYRRIRLTNPAVQQRIGNITGTVDFLLLCGFEKDADGESLEIPEDKVDVLLIQVAGEQLHSAMNNPFFGEL